MAYKDFREWLAKVEEFGELKRIDGVDLDGEVGAVFEVLQERQNLSAVIFDGFAGFPRGYRIAAMAASPRSMALTLGLAEENNVLKMTQAVRKKIRELERVPPKLVDSGPIMENVHAGDDVDLLEFPVPKWNELDGGPYMGTGSVTITRDPDEGWVNLGTYRVQRHDRNSLGFHISAGKHGLIHREKHHGRGEPCPVAISFGHDPLIFVVGSTALPWGVSEYEYAGGLKGEPIEVIEGPVTGLPIPAYAELAIEGEAYPGEVRTEGPFGEFTGYYGSGQRPEPVIRVKSVLHRHDPILLGRAPLKPRAGAASGAVGAANLWNGLERAGIPDVVGVANYVNSFITVVSICQRYPGHSKQVGSLVCQLPGNAHMGRWVIVVDDDIDATNFDEVMWALATRCDPALSIDILRRCGSTPLDPMGNAGLVPHGVPMFNSRAIVDCCVPYELKTRKLFPAVVGASLELRARVEAKFGALLD